MSQITYTTTATATYSAGNTVAVASTVNMFPGLPIVFTGNVFGNITTGTTYYIGDIVVGYPTSNITLTTLPGGSTYGVDNGTGNMTATFNQGGQQIIPTVAPGEPLNQAFTAVNVNFDQIWAAGPVDSNIQITDNSILTTNTNGNINLVPNGIGNVVSSGHILPNSTRIRNLGSPSQKWLNIYAQYLTVDNASLGNIGNITIDVANLHISGGSNGYVLQTDGTGNLTWTAQTGGMGNGVPGGANTQVQYNDAGAFGGTAGFTFDNTSNTLSAVKINTTDVFNSNGIVLENSDLTQGATAAVVIPTNGNSDPIQVNNTYGNIALQTGAGSGITASWSFDNTGNLTIPGNIIMTTGIVGSGLASPAPTLSGFSSVSAITLSASGNISAGNVSTTGNITAANFIGNTFSIAQTILPTIQSIVISNTSSEYETSGGSGYANVLVANVAPVIEYGVIVTAGSTVDKYVTGNLANIPGTEQITISTGTSDQPFTVYAYVTTNAGTYYSGPEVGFSGLCLLKGTMISLADGTYKPIENINNDDLLLTWDFDLGRYAQARPLWIKRGETGTRYNKLTFSDGTILRTFDQHRIFNKQAGAFTYPMSDDTPIGTVTVNEHGQEITLVKREIVWDTIEHYNIITDHHINLFADSILTSCRFNNIYPITDMKFVKDVVVNRNLSEFAEIESRFVSGLRLQEQSFELAMITGYVNRLLATEVTESISI